MALALRIVRGGRTPAPTKPAPLDEGDLHALTDQRDEHVLEDIEFTDAGARQFLARVAACEHQVRLGETDPRTAVRHILRGIRLLWDKWPG
jgi:hypothetical protein